MKLAFNKEKLTTALGIVSRAIPTRTANPILSCILFDASEDGVTLIANDSEFGISTKVEGIVSEKCETGQRHHPQAGRRRRTRQYRDRSEFHDKNFLQ